MTKNNPFERGVDRGGFRDIDARQLQLMPEYVRFIDVRQPEEFEGELGHLPRAELVPLSVLGQVSSHWDKNAPFLMICRSGNRSSQAAAALARVGFTKLGNLAGGMLAVRAEGL